MNGVSEYGEGYPVSLLIKDNDVIIRAYNQAGWDSTNVSLLDIFKWISNSKNIPFGLGIRGYFIRLFFSAACKLAKKSKLLSK